MKSVEALQGVAVLYQELTFFQSHLCLHLRDNRLLPLVEVLHGWQAEVRQVLGDVEVEILQTVGEVLEDGGNAFNLGGQGQELQLLGQGHKVTGTGHSHDSGQQRGSFRDTAGKCRRHPPRAIALHRNVVRLVRELVRADHRDGNFVKFAVQEGSVPHPTLPMEVLPVNGFQALEFDRKLSRNFRIRQPELTIRTIHLVVLRSECRPFLFCIIRSIIPPPSAIVLENVRLEGRIEVADFRGDASELAELAHDLLHRDHVAHLSLSIGGGDSDRQRSGPLRGLVVPQVVVVVHLDIDVRLAARCCLQRGNDADAAVRAEARRADAFVACAGRVAASLLAPAHHASAAGVRGARVQGVDLVAPDYEGDHGPVVHGMHIDWDHLHQGVRLDDIRLDLRVKGRDQSVLVRRDACQLHAVSGLHIHLKGVLPTVNTVRCDGADLIDVLTDGLEA
mmetsp:Transcript_54907/g.178397  ORF Transcript_54907/g.178397 Transcript_54907/m.178397 type:complete len:449 (-) Transcript_54907:356-1702(-)